MLSVRLMICCAVSAARISLAALVVAWIVRRRSAGSSMSVAMAANIIDTWVPMCWSWSALIETGTCATRGASGISPRSVRYERSAPDTVAGTTSLSLTPNASFTALTSASDVDADADERLGVSVPLNGVRGAWNG